MSGLPTEGVAYCGAPPAPATLSERWNLDPILIAALLAALTLYVLGARRAALPNTRIAAFGGGWALAAAALVSPLCALSVSLFAARVGQHMILTLLAAPLLALGRPVAAFAALAGRAPAASRPSRALPAAVVFAALLWFWHAPAPYADTFASAAVYWAMHLSLVGAALWLWGEVLDGAADAGVVGACALSTIQMGLLGALITLSSQAVYAPHRLTTLAWGLTPLEDQQLGGAIMWAPGTLSFLAALAYVSWRALRPTLGGAGPRVVGQAG